MKLSPRQTRWLGRCLALQIRVMGRTWRVRKQGFPSPEPQQGCIEALHHGHMLFYITLYRFCPSVTMISEHRDGRLIADVVRRLGGTVAMGSSTRGGARALLDMLKNHKNLPWVVTPDGPRGPRGSVKEGVIKMAADSNRAIRPHGFAVTPAKVLRSWDEFTIPYPFARVVEYVGDPLHVPPKVDRQARGEFAKDLERRLADANQQAELILARWLQRPGSQEDPAAAQQ